MIFHLETETKKIKFFLKAIGYLKLNRISDGLEEIENLVQMEPNKAGNFEKFILPETVSITA
jgi:hypothetical protein